MEVLSGQTRMVLKMGINGSSCSWVRRREGLVFEILSVDGVSSSCGCRGTNYGDFKMRILEEWLNR